MDIAGRAIRVVHIVRAWPLWLLRFHSKDSSTGERQKGESKKIFYLSIAFYHATCRLLSSNRPLAGSTVRSPSYSDKSACVWSHLTHLTGLTGLVDYLSLFVRRVGHRSRCRQMLIPSTGGSVRRAETWESRAYQKSGIMSLDHESRLSYPGPMPKTRDAVASHVEPLQ